MAASAGCSRGCSGGGDAAREGASWLPFRSGSPIFPGKTRDAGEFRAVGCHKRGLGQQSLRRDKQIVWADWSAIRFENAPDRACLRRVIVIERHNVNRPRKKDTDALTVCGPVRAAGDAIQSS